MRKGICFVLCMLAISMLILGGCAGEKGDSILAETQPDSAAAEVESETLPVSEAEDTQPAGNLIYEYETQELYAKRDDNRIYGVVYIPQDAGAQLPAVIYAHGYGVTHRNGIQYAEKLAEYGYVVYCFDFCGGGNGSQSDGSPLEMSVFTEQSDLEAVIEMVRGLDYVDSENVFLFGASQGGLVAGITAAANQEKIQGLILLYPGFEIAEDAQTLSQSSFLLHWI